MEINKFKENEYIVMVEGDEDIVFEYIEKDKDYTASESLTLIARIMEHMIVAKRYIEIEADILEKETKSETPNHFLLASGSVALEIRESLVNDFKETLTDFLRQMTTTLTSSTESDIFRFTKKSEEEDIEIEGGLLN